MVVVVVVVDGQADPLGSCGIAQSEGEEKLGKTKKEGNYESQLFFFTNIC